MLPSLLLTLFGVSVFAVQHLGFANSAQPATQALADGIRREGA